MGYTPHVVVVGGGATGTAIARDLAMRGLEVTLVEGETLAAGATGRSTGLLHSGARLAVSDPDIAARCAEENERLRDVASHCVEETGGVLAEVSGDESSLATTREACLETGISVEEFDSDELQKLEPRLSPDVERGLFVPDGTVDPFRLTVANAASARSYGATIETGTRVTGVVVEEDAVRAVRVSRGHDGDTDEIRADYVVNAAGSGAARVAAMAGVDVTLRVATGTMVVGNARPTEAVVTRCRRDGPGESLVPFDRQCVLSGSTDDGETRETALGDKVDVDSVLSEFAALLPEIDGTRTLRAFSRDQPHIASSTGQEDSGSGFAVLDHENRDGLWGLTTVVGGPLTLCRFLAEAATDQVCEKFGISRECLTATHRLPGSDGTPDVEALARDLGLDRGVASRSADRLGSRTRDVLETNRSNPVVCACESVTRAEVGAALDDPGEDPLSLDAFRVRTRAGMGECQGGRCSHRMAAELHPAAELATVDAALAAFDRRRWAGQRHALWGNQLAAAMETYTLHTSTMNRTRDAGDLELDAFDTGTVCEGESPDRRGNVP